jgi:hypothetical protein
MRWIGPPVCKRCYCVAKAGAEARELACSLLPELAAKNKPVQVVTIGTMDGEELLVRHGAMVALADARAAEIERGRPTAATLH